MFFGPELPNCDNLLPDFPFTPRSLGAAMSVVYGKRE